jgi:ribosomal protein S17E
VLEVNDSGYIGKIPASCLIAQVAYYDEKTNLAHYDSRITSVFSPNEIRNLRLHEDIYRYKRALASGLNENCKNARRLNQSACELMTIDSSSVRNAVAYLITHSQYEKEILDDLLWYGNSRYR